MIKSRTNLNLLRNRGIYMGSLNPSPELSLDFKPIFVPKTISQFLGQVSRIGRVSEKVLRVDDFVQRLETETRKIEAFKRELPLSMLLVHDAIVALKEESRVLKKSSDAEPVLEEFIPLKNSHDNDDAKVEITTKQKDSGDKKNWLSSTQLWNTDENLNQKANSVGQIIKRGAAVADSGRAFVTPGINNRMRGNGLLTKIDSNSRLVPCSTPNVQSNIQIGCPQPQPPQQQTSRKQRRCWSTELHRRFVNALQQLGGSQVATPKQIRELMQVDGLTNDEVKSHLQKYRLHTRRLPSSNTCSNQSGALLGGSLWMSPQDQDVGSSRCSNSQLGSPDGPLLNGGNSMGDEEDEKSENHC